MGLAVLYFLGAVMIIVWAVFVSWTAGSIFYTGLCEHDPTQFKPAFMWGVFGYIPLYIISLLVKR